MLYYLLFYIKNVKSIMTSGNSIIFYFSKIVLIFLFFNYRSCDIYEGKSERYENVNELKFAKMKEIVIPLKSPIGVSFCHFTPND